MTTHDDARSLAHDVRGRLNSLVLNLDLLRRAVDDGVADHDLRRRCERYLAAIEREIDKLNDRLALVAGGEG